jgi:hypothetical protein
LVAGGPSLDEIVGGVKRVAGIVSEIAAASREQAAGVQEVEGTVSSMEVVTQKNASLVEETTASLNAASGCLRMSWPTGYTCRTRSGSGFKSSISMNTIAFRLNSWCKLHQRRFPCQG